MARKNMYDFPEPRVDLGVKTPRGLLATTWRDKSGREDEPVVPGAGDYDPRFPKKR